MKTQKKSRFRIEKLEERIAPIVHCITPLNAAHPGVVNSGGSAGGTAALFTNGGPILGCNPAVNNPGVGS